MMDKCTLLNYSASTYTFINDAAATLFRDKQQCLSATNCLCVSLKKPLLHPYHSDLTSSCKALIHSWICSLGFSQADNSTQHAEAS